MEVAKLGDKVPPAFHYLPYTHKPAIELAVGQALDGVWNESLLDVPTKSGQQFEDVGTVHAVRRLLEYGWDKDSPPILQARRVLFRLLSEDDDPALYFEFAPKMMAKGVEEEQRAMVRQLLREAAGAVLAQAPRRGPSHARTDDAVPQGPGRREAVDSRRQSAGALA
jgi:hypothetical protein